MNRLLGILNESSDDFSGSEILWDDSVGLFTLDGTRELSLEKVVQLGRAGYVTWSRPEIMGHLEAQLICRGELSEDISNPSSDSDAGTLDIHRENQVPIKPRRRAPMLVGALLLILMVTLMVAGLSMSPKLSGGLLFASARSASVIATESSALVAKATETGGETSDIIPVDAVLASTPAADTGSMLLASGDSVVSVDFNGKTRFELAGKSASPSEFLALVAGKDGPREFSVQLRSSDGAARSASEILAGDSVCYVVRAWR